MNIEGKVWRYGDNIDTDVIIPARYLNTFAPAELAKHCMVDIDETFAANVKAGDIMVGGKNFGCGSSREHAAIAPRYLGIKAVIAASFARIHKKNLINFGILPIELDINADLFDEIVQKLKDINNLEGKRDTNNEVKKS